MKRTNYNDGHSSQFEDAHGAYSLSSFPNCYDLGISFGTYINQAQRGKGLGQIQHLHRLEESRKMGHSYLLCTVNEHNKTEKHILAKNGWKKLDDFIGGFSNDDLSRTEIWGRRQVQGENGHT